MAEIGVDLIFLQQPGEFLQCRHKHFIREQRLQDWLVEGDAQLLGELIERKGDSLGLSLAVGPPFGAFGDEVMQ